MEFTVLFWVFMLGIPAAAAFALVWLTGFWRKFEQISAAQPDWAGQLEPEGAGAPPACSKAAAGN